MIFPQKSGHGVKPQELKPCILEELRTGLMNAAFFGCRRSQCNKTGFQPLTPITPQSMFKRKQTNLIINY